MCEAETTEACLPHIPRTEEVFVNEVAYELESRSSYFSTTVEVPRELYILQRYRLRSTQNVFFYSCIHKSQQCLAEVLH